jgi:radical SAM superfamily enzyme YgiQ (UPF0313 family)
MPQLRIDYVVADRPSHPSFIWHKTGVPPLNISLLKAMTPQELDGYTIVARCHHERTMGPYNVSIERPDILALSIYTPGARRAYELADESLVVSSWQGGRVRTLAGGHHATALPVEAIAHVDALVRGRTTSGLLKAALRWLIRHIEEGSAEKRVFELSPAIVGASLTRRVIPDRTWYHSARYYMPNGLQTSLGCPFACHFCATTFAEGAMFRPFDYTTIERDVGTLKHGDLTAIIDDNFLPTPQSEHARRVCDILRRHGIRWQAALTPRTLHRNMRELVPLFASSGCRVLFFGFETIRGGMAKSANLEQYRELIRCCHDYGISVIGAFVFGLDDNEDAGIFERTVAWATAAKCDMGYFSLNTPLPGACDFEMAVRNNLILDWDWEHYDTWYPVRRYARMSSEEMYDGIRSVYRWFYEGRSIRARIAGRITELFHDVIPHFLLKQIGSIALTAAVGSALGRGRPMQWRLKMRYEEYRDRIVATPNPLVQAQFSDDIPIGQFDPHRRTQELQGTLKDHTALLLHDRFPVTYLQPDDGDTGEETSCPA